jgi:hypothetical protein
MASWTTFFVLRACGRWGVTGRDEVAGLKIVRALEMNPRAVIIL